MIKEQHILHKKTTGTDNEKRGKEKILKRRKKNEIRKLDGALEIADEEADKWAGKEEWKIWGKRKKDDFPFKLKRKNKIIK